PERTWHDGGLSRWQAVSAPSIALSLGPTGEHRNSLEGCDVLLPDRLYTSWYSCAKLSGSRCGSPLRVFGYASSASIPRVPRRYLAVRRHVASGVLRGRAVVPSFSVREFHMFRVFSPSALARVSARHPWRVVSA